MTALTHCWPRGSAAGVASLASARPLRGPEAHEESAATDDPPDLEGMGPMIPKSTRLSLHIYNVHGLCREDQATVARPATTLGLCIPVRSWSSPPAQPATRRRSAALVQPGLTPLECLHRLTRHDHSVWTIDSSCPLDAMASAERKPAPGSLPGLTLATFKVAGALLQASAAIDKKY